MKIFSNKKLLFKLIVALCIFLVLTGCIHPNVVHAGWFETTKGAAETGGKLLTPIIDLILSLGDAVIDILQQAIMGTDSAITIDTVAKTLIGIVLAVLAVVVIAIVAAAIGPALAAILPILSTIVVGAIGVAIASGAAWAYTAISGELLPDITILPTYSISPEEIFKGEILLFDVNIFNPKELYVRLKNEGSEITMTADQWKQTTGSDYEVKYYYYYKDGNSSNSNENNIIITSANNSAFDLRSTVSKWYYTIRNIALIGLMIVLAYVGIRMLISTTATEKSKYKQMLGDWVIAMCLIFVMQYIMVFANNFTESMTLLLSSVSDEEHHTSIIMNADDALIEGVKEAGLSDTVQGSTIIWPSNLMGRIRIVSQEQDGTTGYIGYALCYLVLVIYTVIFTVTYAKRLLYIVFFTIISPLVALTYPIDKINDGKAQAFNIWLKEYIFNLLIQPFHLLLYTVLISTAFDLASTNIIYTLVAIGFMIPAEKFLRKMFGFDKASTPGFLEGATGAAFAMHGLHSLEKIAGRGPGSKNKNNESGQQKDSIDFMDRGADSGHKTTDLLNSMGNPRIAEEQQRIQQENQQEEQQKILKENQQEEQQRTQQENQQIERQRMQQENRQIEQQEIEQNEEQGNERIEQNNNENNIYNSPKRIDSWQDHKGEYMKVRLKNWGRRIKNASNFKENISENFDKSLKKTIKLGGSLAMGAGGATIGLAAGIASGNLDSVGKNTIAGAYSGSAIGTGLSNKMAQQIDLGKEKHEETLKEMYGEDYSNYIKQQKDDKFRNDANMRAIYSRAFSNSLSNLGRKEKKEKLDRIMDEAIEYRRYGVTDNDTIIKAMKIDKGNPLEVTDQDRKERIAAAKLAGVSKTGKDLETTMKRFKETPGVTNGQVQTMERRIRQMNDIN